MANPLRPIAILVHILFYLVYYLWLVVTFVLLNLIGLSLLVYSLVTFALHLIYSGHHLYASFSKTTFLMIRLFRFVFTTATLLLTALGHLTKVLKSPPLVPPRTLQCPICLTNMNINPSASPASWPFLITKPCGHIYCSPCIRTWIRQRPSCPLCRQVVNVLTKNWQAARAAAN